MPKITFIGAGSTVFAKNVLGDSMLTPSLCESEIALYDIDAERLRDSELMLMAINNNVNAGKARIKTYLGVENRKEALKGAKYVINSIQVGGYKPCTVTDLDLPKKYGLQQTIGDTLGIGGIFRTLRTLPVMMDFARDIEEVCPEAWFLNYVNPMAMLTGALQRFTGVKTVGLCHSVQGCARGLLRSVGLPTEGLEYKIAGINHMAWLLEVKCHGVDMYPEIKRLSPNREDPTKDAVRHEIMHRFGYYVTESSEHNAEYMPYWIKSKYPEQIERYKIPIDLYLRRCERQIANWEKRREELTNNPLLDHNMTSEYASNIMDAMETNVPFKIGGNVINNGLIPNLPDEACVEIPCLVDRSGVAGCYVGRLPEQLAALNRTNINVQFLTIDAAMTLKKESIYHAALLDPHTSSELSIDEIISLCDDLIEAHGDWLPKYH